MNDLNVFSYGFRPWKYLRNWPHNLKNCFRNIKRAWQRATRGYSDWDCRELDTFYLNLFESSLEHFRRYNEEYPANMTEDEWRETITEMINCFHRAQEKNFHYNPYSEDFYKMIDANDYNPIADDASDQRDLINHYFKYEKYLKEKRTEAIQRGTELLGKYLPHLWW